ncbi:MAG: DMT family transporter [Chloroflexi bacterium]|nr:DMT family transporter [Chloroflexota bacterium]
MKSRGLPMLVLAFGILAVSMSAILVRWANAPPTVIGFWRMLFAALVMTIPAGNALRRAPRATRHTLFAALAGFFFAINLAVWNTGALITTAANVTLLGNLSIIWVPLAAMFVFKTRLRRAFWGGLALAAVGVMLILGQDLLAHPALGVGDAYGIGASFLYTVYLLAMERARAGLSALIAWWLSTVVGAVTLLALSIALGAPLAGYPLTSFAIFATMAFVVQIGGFLSLNYALGHLPAPLVSTSLLAQMVITALLAVPLLGQSLALVQAIGGLLVLLGIFVVHRSKTKG